jgi:lambda family phage portal protein
MGYFVNLLGAITGKPSGVVYNRSGYDAATNGRRMINVGNSTRGVSSLALSDGPMLLARARKAVMDNPLAGNGVRSFVAEVVGTGIRPHSQHSDPRIRRIIEQEFSLWTSQSSAVRRIGADGKPDSLQDFYLQQELVCANAVVAGEAFARLRPRLAADLSPTGLRVPLQIDLIEPEQLAWWRMTGDMASPLNLIRGGIEFNQIHERIAYHFYRDNPGDSTLWPNAFEIVRVPSGNVLHVMEFIRGDQIRGITSLASILVTLSDLDDYDDAERMRQKLGAYLFAWKKTLTPDDPLNGTTGTVGTDIAPPGTAYVESQPGQVNILDTNAGEEFDFYSHPGVSNTYETFMRVQHQTIATILRISYEMLTGNMNQVNFASARIRLIALKRIWKQFQKSVMVHQFCRPVWRAWLDAAALAGVIDAADYRKNPQEYLNVEWLAQPWEWTDPKSDVAAIRMKIESALTSREAEVTALGKDPEENDAAIARDHEREKRLGIDPVYGNSRVNIAEPPGDNGDLTDTPAPADGSEPDTGAEPAKAPAKAPAKKAPAPAPKKGKTK